MKLIRTIFCFACIAIPFAVLAYLIRLDGACKANGGELLRGVFSGYQCYKAERVK